MAGKDKRYCQVIYNKETGMLSGRVLFTQFNINGTVESGADYITPSAPSVLADPHYCPLDLTWKSGAANLGGQTRLRAKWGVHSAAHAIFGMDGSEM